ncbi:MAG: response regulator [Anaerolineae bacterium]|nr:response regulator [Anaerolineae bacterium]
MSTKRVLVIDDSADIRKLLADYVLKPAGFEIVIAGDGAEGLRLARELRPDLLILDCEMPHLTGLEVLDRLSRDGIRIPTIFTSAERSESLIVRALRVGVRDFVPKPFTTEEMFDAIQRANSTHPRRRPRRPPPGRTARPCWIGRNWTPSTVS